MLNKTESCPILVDGVPDEQLHGVEHTDIGDVGVAVKAIVTAGGERTRTGDSLGGTLGLPTAVHKTITVNLSVKDRRERRVCIAHEEVYALQQCFYLAGNAWVCGPRQIHPSISETPQFKGVQHIHYLQQKNHPFLQPSFAEHVAVHVVEVRHKLLSKMGEVHHTDLGALSEQASEVEKEAQMLEQARTPQECQALQDQSQSPHPLDQRPPRLLPCLSKLSRLPPLATKRNHHTSWRIMQPAPHPETKLRKRQVLTPTQRAGDHLQKALARSETLPVQPAIAFSVKDPAGTMVLHWKVDFDKRTC